MTIKILACSDIHYHHYHNGLSLQDVIDVGDEFIDLCKKHQVDMVILGGDYTMSRNPMYEVHLAITNWFKRLSHLGIPIIALMGNHDRVYKSDHKIHILEHINLYPKDFPNIHLFNDAHSYVVPIKGQTVAIHGVPAGHNVPDFTFDKTFDWHIGLFHGMIIGSKYQNGSTAEEGMPPQTFDRPEYDLVLGGDNHAYQGLLFEHTHGLYLGAPMQHNWGDADALRGFCLITLDQHPEVVQLESKAPKFFKCQARIDDIVQLSQFLEAVGPKWKNNIISLRLSGTSGTLQDIMPHEWSEKIKKKYLARSVEIHLDYDLDRTPQVQPTIRTEVEEWEEFFVSAGAPIVKGLDPEKLKKMGYHYINHA